MPQLNTCRADCAARWPHWTGLDCVQRRTAAATATAAHGFTGFSFCDPVNSSE